jgi:hypothetical protein
VRLRVHGAHMPDDVGRRERHLRGSDRRGRRRARAAGRDQPPRPAPRARRDDR